MAELDQSKEQQREQPGSETPQLATSFFSPSRIKTFLKFTGILFASILFFGLTKDVIRRPSPNFIIAWILYVTILGAAFRLISSRSQHKRTPNDESD